VINVHVVVSKLPTCSRPNAPAELRPTGANAGITQKAYAVGRQLQWVVRLGMASCET
jgi:hypothetical protein